MKLYRKEKIGNDIRNFFLGLPFSYQKCVDNRVIISKFFGLYKKVKNGTYVYTYFMGIRVKKSPDIRGLVQNVQKTIALLQTEISEIGQKCYNIEQKTISLEILSRLIDTQTVVHNSKIDVDNLLLKINRLIMSDISTALIHQKTFGPYRGCFRGKKVALICTGPTFNQFSVDDLDKDTIYVGVNAAFKRVDVQYLFCQDYVATQPYLGDLLAYNPDTCVKFLAQLPEMSTEYTNNIAETVFNNPNVKKYKIDFVDKYYRRNCSFLPVDITTQPLGDWETVAASAMQFILFGQPDVVYMVGCDCSMNHFSEQYDVVKDLDFSVLAANFWPTLKKFADMYYPKTKIISVNPVGLKGMFNDVYTQNYLNEHPEINRDKIEFLKGGNK